MTTAEAQQAVRRLRKMLELLDRNELGKERAVRALEICGLLQLDERLPLDVDYERIRELLEVALGQPLQGEAIVRWRPGSVDKEASVVRIARGVALGFSKNRRLVVITVDPEEFRIAEKLMAFVGIAADPDPQASTRLDEYIVDAYLNAGKLDGVD